MPPATRKAVKPVRTRQRRPRTAAVTAVTVTVTAAVALALASGCTGGAGDPPPAVGAQASAGAAADGQVTASAPADAAEQDQRWATLTSAVPAGLPFEPYFEALRREDAELGPAVEQAQADLEAAREEVVAGCMAERGYDVAEEHVVGDSGAAGVISGPIQAFYLAVMTGADGQVAPRDQYLGDALPEDQRSLIQSAPEIDIALADFDCRERTDYMTRLIALQRELETAFVADNKAALDELLAAIEANLATS